VIPVIERQLEELECTGIVTTRHVARRSVAAYIVYYGSCR